MEFEEDKNETEIKMMNYNVANFTDHKNWEVRSTLLAKTIISENADIIGLQELRYDSSIPRNAFSDLIHKLPEYPYYLWQPAMFYSYSSKTLTEGLGILSKFPILSHSYTNLTKSSGDQNQRIVLKAIIEYKPSETLNYYLTHLTYDRAGQLQQAYELYKFIQSSQCSQYLKNKDFEKDKPDSLERKEGRKACIISGDFNIDDLSDDSYRFLNGEIEYMEEKSDLADVWSVLREEHELGFTYSTSNPAKRIDFFFYQTHAGVRPVSVNRVGGPDSLTRFRTKNKDKKGKKGGAQIYPSDHYAVVVNFNLFSIGKEWEIC
jgi:endonuclease/exonuclease/phosphatase family metal-dependent hydrolase